LNVSEFQVVNCLDPAHLQVLITPPNTHGRKHQIGKACRDKRPKSLVSWAQGTTIFGLYYKTCIDLTLVYPLKADLGFRFQIKLVRFIKKYALV